jgi:hypothetical protein
VLCTGQASSRLSITASAAAVSNIRAVRRGPSSPLFPDREPPGSQGLGSQGSPRGAAVRPQAALDPTLNLLPLWDCKQYSAAVPNLHRTPHLSLLPLAVPATGLSPNIPAIQLCQTLRSSQSCGLHDNESGQSRKAWSQTVLIGLAGVNQSVRCSMVQYEVTSLNVQSTFAYFLWRNISLLLSLPGQAPSGYDHASLHQNPGDRFREDDDNNYMLLESSLVVSQGRYPCQQY